MDMGTIQVSPEERAMYERMVQRAQSNQGKPVSKPSALPPVPAAAKAVVKPAMGWKGKTALGVGGGIAAQAGGELANPEGAPDIPAWAQTAGGIGGMMLAAPNPYVKVAGGALMAVPAGIGLYNRMTGKQKAPEVNVQGNPDMNVNGPEFELMRNHYLTANAPDVGEGTPEVKKATIDDAVPLPKLPQMDNTQIVRPEAPKDKSISVQEAYGGPVMGKGMAGIIAHNDIGAAQYQGAADEDQRNLNVWKQGMDADANFANANTNRQHYAAQAALAPYQAQHFAAQTKHLSDDPKYKMAEMQNKLEIAQLMAHSRQKGAVPQTEKASLEYYMAMANQESDKVKKVNWNRLALAEAQKGRTAQAPSALGESSY
jgi:hypothetical protein